jgi:CRP/FNR family transcriptional regulator, cyclic AMP receptor protein
MSAGGTDHAEVEARVAAHPFLLGMSEQHIRLLADCALLTRFQPGQRIFEAGQRANRFYLIETGEVGIEASIAERPAVAIDVVKAGDLLGWSWMFPPFVWHFDARALLPTTAIFFYGTVLSEYCEKNSALGYELFKRMSAVMLRRLQAAREKMLGALGH